MRWAGLGGGCWLELGTCSQLCYGVCVPLAPLAGATCHSALALPPFCPWGVCADEVLPWATPSTAFAD